MWRREASQEVAQLEARLAIRKQRVAGAFDGAEGYHREAALQREVAARLAHRLERLSLPARPRLLEIGCGSGFLSGHLLARWGDAGEFVFSDISPAMTRRARTHLGQGAKRHYLVMDGERPACRGGFHLITASLAFQWFNDFAGGVAGLTGLLAPGGTLLFTTLGRETFREWRGACLAHGVPCGTPDYPSAEALEALWPVRGVGSVTEERIPVTHPDGRAFLSHLKEVGAHRADITHTPANPGAMRRLLRELEGNPFQVTYHVLTGRFDKSGGR